MLCDFSGCGVRCVHGGWHCTSHQLLVDFFHLRGAVIRQDIVVLVLGSCYVGCEDRLPAERDFINIISVAIGEQLGLWASLDKRGELI